MIILGEIMKKYYSRSDLATESLKNAIKDKDYRHSQVTYDGVIVESFEIMGKSDAYPHDVGNYVEIIFDDYTKQDTIISVMKKQLKTYIKAQCSKLDPLILYVGLGNSMLTSDAIGPKCIANIDATHQLSIEDRHLKLCYDTLCFAPSVKGKTGMETADVIEALAELYKPDVVIVIDALCAQSYKKLCRVIQMNNVGIYPGGGVGNHRKAITKRTMNVPVIGIGVPTVIHASSLVNHVYTLIEGYFSESLKPSSKLKVSSRKEYTSKLTESQKRLVLGEVGMLEDEERKQLFYEILLPLDEQFVMSDKGIDVDIDVISRMISEAINSLRI